MSEERKISWFEGTPLGISIYSSERIPTQLHDENILEIIFQQVYNDIGRREQE